MFDRLDDMLIHYEELMQMLGDPGVTQDTKRFTKLMKEQADLAPIVETYRDYKQAKQDAVSYTHLAFHLCFCRLFPVRR